MPGTGMNYYEMMRRQVRDARGWWAIRAALVLILLVALLLIPASARAYTAPQAASGLTMQVNAGFHTRYRGWVPVYITLGNTSTDFIGTLSISISRPVPPPGRRVISPSGYQEPINLPKGAQQQATMYIPLLINSIGLSLFDPQSLVINLLDRRGNVIRTQTNTPIPVDPADVFVGILSDQQSGFGPLSAVSLPDQDNSVIVEPLDAQTMPDMTTVLENFDIIVLDDFTTDRLSLDQLRALQVWVNRGGRLIVVGGAPWQRTLSALPPGLLPVVVNGTSTLQAGTHLLPISGPEVGNVGQNKVTTTVQEPITVSTTTASGQGDSGSEPGRFKGQSSASASETILASGSIPLIVQARRGQGYIYYLAFDPAQEALNGWSGARTLWKELLLRALGDQLLLSHSTSRYSNDIGQLIQRVRMFNLLPAGAPPDPWMLILLLLSYIVVLGSVNILIARRLKRSIWSWHIILSSIVIFTLLCYGLAFYQREASISINSISLMQLSQDGSSAYSTTYASVFVPNQGDYQVHIPGKGLAQLIPDIFYQHDADFSDEERSLAIIPGQHQTNVNLSGASMWNSHAILTEQDRPTHGGIISHLVVRDGKLTGTITNTLNSSLSDAYVLIPRSFARIGHIAAGQTLQVNLPFSSATSDSDMALADQLARNSGLPTPYIPHANGSPPQTDLQRHLAILSVLSRVVEYDFTACNECGMRTIEHMLVAPFASETAISPSNSIDPLLVDGTPASFIGWAEQPLDTNSDMTINSFEPAGLHETLVQAPLTLKLSSPQNLSSNFISGQVIDVQGNDLQSEFPGVYTMSTGHITFEFALPNSADRRFSSLTIMEPANLMAMLGPGMGRVTDESQHARLYNWSKGAWESISLSQNTFTTQNTGAYIGQGERILVQFTNQRTSLGTVVFGKPSLTLKGEA